MDNKDHWDGLRAEFAEAFILPSHEEHVHHTPFRADQQFIYCMYQKALA